MVYNKSKKLIIRPKGQSNTWVSRPIKQYVKNEIRKEAGSYNYYVSSFCNIAANNTETNASLTGYIALDSTTTAHIGTRTSTTIQVLGYEIKALIVCGASPTTNTVRIIVCQEESNAPFALINIEQPLSKLWDPSLLKVYTDKVVSVGTSPNVRQLRVKRWFKKPIEVTYASGATEATTPWLVRLISYCNGTYTNPLVYCYIKLMYRG